MMAGRYGHAKQFNRHRPQLRILRSRLGRLIRDIGRKIAGHEQIDAAFASAASSSIPSMNRRPSASARARRARPTSSGSRSSPPTPAPPGGQFVLHAKALPGNPYDSHTLRDVIEDTQKLTGCEIERSYVDKGYHGHDAENPRPRLHLRTKARHLRWHQTRTATMLRHRAGDRPPKAEGHLGRCYLKGRAGDAANAILSAIGYNFRRILAWLRALLRLFMIAILRLLISRSPLIPAS
jgi:IS5 family transposase